MMNEPKTRAEAQQRRYGLHYRQQPYDPACCAYEVVTYRGAWPNHAQCSRKPGHGPDALYCKQHAKKVENQ